nr:homocysteine S-methyltransferase family protein [Oleomonas cavernae]
MSNFLDHLDDRILLCDGAMGSRVQALNLDTDKDFDGRENCTEVLNRTRPDVVRDIHLSYLLAGSDMVQTNSFGGSPITLAEFDLQDETFELNKRAGEIAREAIEQLAHDGRKRFVLGSIGPGTRLPSLGHIAYDPLELALTAQAEGLIAGGVDAILIETCQDTLQIKAAVNGAKIARAKLGTNTPIAVQVTVETTGTLLVGPDIAAAATVIHALDVPLIGLNCATGPRKWRNTSSSCRKTGRAASPCSPMPACPNCWTARPIIRSARRTGQVGAPLRSGRRHQHGGGVLRHWPRPYPRARPDAAFD